MVVMCSPNGHGPLQKPHAPAHMPHEPPGAPHSAAPRARAAPSRPPGSLTPWGTHLGSEEYEPDARAFIMSNSVNSRVRDFARYWGLYQVREGEGPGEWGV